MVSGQWLVERVESGSLISGLLRLCCQRGVSLILRGMNRVGSILFLAWLAATLAGECSALFAQTTASTRRPDGSAFSDVQLDVVDNAVLAQVERAKALLADRQWDEGVDVLCQLAESTDGKVLGVTRQRYVRLNAWCQLQFAALPKDVLRRYRARIDPVAKQRYEDGVTQRSSRLLGEVVEQMLASSFGDDALLALGDLALESGDYAQASASWERILPNATSSAAPTWQGYPDTDLDIAAVRARIILASILEGRGDRARAELAEFAKLHPGAVGRLGGRDGVFVETLRALLHENERTAASAVEQNWPTVAGNFERNGISRPLIDVGGVAWRMPLGEGVDSAGAMPPPSFHPVLIGDTVLVNDGRQIVAVRSDSGKPTWGQRVIFRAETDSESATDIRSDATGTAPFTMSVVENRLLARMGRPIADATGGWAISRQPGYLVCLDLSAEGRLVWRIAAEEGWEFEGSPVADASGVYVAMRRHDVRPQAFVACFDADTGRLRWRRMVCNASTLPGGASSGTGSNLLTLSHGRLYYATNLGAVAALRAEDGWPFWVSLYPRVRCSADDLRHGERELSPCLCAGGTLLVAPSDSPRVFGFDAFTGQLLWQSQSDLEDARTCLAWQAIG